jgi:hypothetical protein
MRKEVIELEKLGTLPNSDTAAVETVKNYQDLIVSIKKPITDDEARALIKVFGPDDCFGLAETLLHLVESAPGWPLEDCLKNNDNEWIQLLKLRIENGKHFQARKSRL